MRLHRLHFVEKKGNDAIEQLIQEKRKEGQRADAEREKVFKGRLRELQEAMDQKVKNAMSGSMSIWTAEEKQKIAEARSDPEKAMQKMTHHMRELTRRFQNQVQDMTERVKSVPPMNVRTKEEWSQIAEHRHDPELAKKHMTQKLRDQSRTFYAMRTEMKGRVSALPNESVWTPEERARLRQHSADARSSTKHVKELMKEYSEEMAAMEARLQAMPPMSFWSQEEREMFNEVRTDPEKARMKMAMALKRLHEEERQRTAAMEAKIANNPKMTFWTKEEKDRFAETRIDPEGAKARATANMRQLALTYKQQKGEMEDRVKSIPFKTFLTEEEKEYRRYIKRLKEQQFARLPMSYTVA